MTECPRGVSRPLPADVERLLHDLRGPLNSATMHAELLRRGVAADARAAESLRTLLQQLGRLAEMLPVSFEIATLERGPVERVDLRGLVEEVLTEPALSTFTQEPGVWPVVVGDGRLLRLAVAHLARNAVEASPAGGPRPAVGAVQIDDGRVALRVRNWGTRLPSTNPKVLIRLFHSSKPGHRGLGLVTADRIARLHEGSLEFESPPDGALVTLVLPAAP